MQKIPIHLAEPGMVLARPIISETGMQLCGEETVLTESIIARLKKMQITAIMLKGNPVDSGAKQVSNDECVKELNARFSKIKNDPLMDKLKAAIENALVDQNEKDISGASKGSSA
jgi:hypothetical protein